MQHNLIGTLRVPFRYASEDTVEVFRVDIIMYSTEMCLLQPLLCDFDIFSLNIMLISSKNVRIYKHKRIHTRVGMRGTGDQNLICYGWSNNSVTKLILRLKTYVL